MRATSFYSAAAAETFSPPAPSPWHSPVPYLFGGLAAMLGLIAVALLLLACSYLNLEREEGGGGSFDEEAAPTTFEEKILVIMAGDMKPTFLATPSGRFSLPNEEKIKESDENMRKTEN